VETGSTLVEHLADMWILAEIHKELECGQHVLIAVRASRFVVTVTEKWTK
jgi:hypothetical protein